MRGVVESGGVVCVWGEVGVRVRCESCGWRLSLCWAWVGQAVCVVWSGAWGGKAGGGRRRQVQTLTKDDKDAQDKKDPSDSEASDPQGVVICGRRVTSGAEYGVQGKEEQREEEPNEEEYAGQGGEERERKGKCQMYEERRAQGRGRREGGGGGKKERMERRIPQKVGVVGDGAPDAEKKPIQMGQGLK